MSGQRIYVSSQGDRWDVIAMRVYGFKRGNEHLMYRLLEANQPLVNIVLFPAGLTVVVPDIDPTAEFVVPLVPWTNATFSPSP